MKTLRDAYNNGELEAREINCILRLFGKKYITPRWKPTHRNYSPILEREYNDWLILMETVTLKDVSLIPYEQLKNTRNLGNKSLRKIYDVLKQHGYETPDLNDLNEKKTQKSIKYLTELGYVVTKE